MAEGCSAMTDWSAIVRRHGALVWKTAYRLLGQDADAADVFQETFLSAVEVVRREPVGNWPGLLQRLATMRALDHLRRRIRDRRGRDCAPEWESLPTSDADPVQEAEATELADRLRSALAQLPSRQSELFCLRHVAGLSYEEISAQLDMSVDAVGVMLHRARGKLRELLIGGSVDECPER